MTDTAPLTDASALRPLGRWEKIGVGLILLMFVVFGAIVEQRSAFLSRRMGDLDVFLRAAWAVRNDADLYAITSDNDWHYLYPPLYAILLTPLADPPKNADPAGYVPYAASVAICYLISFFSLFAGAHVLAKALEDCVFADGAPAYCRRWWVLRLWPVLICFLPIGHTLMRGQANVIVLAMLCAAMAGWIRGHGFRAGLWLAFAICIKVIPVYLLVYPLWKRDGRALAGVGIGCFAGLVLIPLLVFGSAKTVTHYETYAKAFFGPFFGAHQDDRSREELATTDSIGVKNAIHNWMNPDQKTRPEDMNAIGKAAYLLLGFGMTFLTLWPGTRRRDESPARTASVFGCLILLMAIFSPVSHRHYLLFCVPIVMCLLAATWNQQRTLRVPWGLAACFVVFNVTMFVAYLPDLEGILKDRCAALFATLPLWVMPVWMLWRRPAVVKVETETNPVSRAA
jgi:alpha-1,2-mannosyltransferase